MKTTSRVFAVPIFLGLAWSSSIFAADIEITIAANSEIVESFQKWTQQTPCDQIISFDSPFANRGTVELVLICKALKAAGLKHTINVKAYPNYARAIMEVSQGRAHISAETLWKTDIDEIQFFMSDPIISNGEFEKGIYTIANNTQTMNATTLDALKTLSAVMVKTWKVDWSTLEAMGIAKLNNASTKGQLFRMIGEQHADFTLLEFSNAQDLSNTLEGVKLIPVPGIKVGLQGSRHFVVSRNMENSQVIFQALSGGIKILHEQGVIKKAFEESGFYNRRVKDWRKIF